jgi:phage terminase large subunit-like protein
MIHSPNSNIKMSAPIPRDHAAIGIQYAKDVVAGRINVCKWVRLAAKRHLDDMQRKPSADWPYTFDAEKGNRFCRFAELLPHVEGPKAGKNELFVLMPWQAFICTSIFGWVRTDTGKRRFRRVYMELGRGQGKSFLASAIGLFCLAADGEAGAQVVSASKSRDMAKIVTRTAQMMARKSPKLCASLGIEVTAHGIHVKSTGSRFETVASETGGNEGRSIHCGIVDEVHTHKDRDTLDSIETGTAKRDQSLLFQITTAGTDRTSICWETRTYGQKILEAVVDDHAYFVCIYSIDEEDADRWYAPEVIAKANPNYGESVQPDVVEALAKKALTMPAFQAAFKQRHLCVWTNASAAFFDMGSIDRCKDETLTIEEFAGEPCYIGLDLATKNDIAAKVYIFPREIDGVIKYAMFGRYYLPEQAIKDSRNAQYSGWQAAQQMTVTDGDVLDFSVVEADLMDDMRLYDVQEICADPWQSAQLSQRMMANGAPMMEFRQTVAGMSEPMKLLDSLLRSGRIMHNDAIWTWMASCVTAHMDAKENVYPRKETPSAKIDGVVAAIMALARAMMRIEEEDAPLIAFA